MAHPLIHDLLQIGAVKVETEDLFTWTSGLRSPIYCDNRLTMSYPDIRSNIAYAFTDKIKRLSSDVDLIAGCATAGIPHAAWVADILDKPMVYVRSSAKKHGKGNQIEGHFHQGQKAVVIEDLVSTGKSSIQAAEALRESGVEVVQVLSIFTYNLKESVEAFRKHDLPYQALASYDQLLEVMVEEGQLSEEQEKSLSQWKEDPTVFTMN
ncbi:orotate phosphoribosyltransferase [Halobacillus yeomjeoni]|uniref:orotate phosphoribosyltransferase n=1 Tax=Halobacillus yeomjeoni TaxID=311194 RepID=UPI001CD29376|nr:orotate phosphoribosyltransferase [Halobacillus yeomjeoni]MCA0983540.1 orotate phosphoribosyltransferase [Halobacillus yeomjeoni]